MRVWFFALRVVVVGALVLGGALLAVILPDRLLHAAPATSFDGVFGRMEKAGLAGAVLGLAAGVAGAPMLGRRRAPAGARWGEAVLAGGVFLVLLAVVFDLS